MQAWNHSVVTAVHVGLVAVVLEPPALIAQREKAEL
jgi:hypothetical protein